MRKNLRENKLNGIVVSEFKEEMNTILDMDAQQSPARINHIRIECLSP